MSPIINLLIFGGLAVAMLIMSVMAITTKSLLRSATYLLLTLICTAGFYLFLNYHFLAAVQVSVYAGGVVVLFVFAIFLTTKKDEVLVKHEYRRYVYGALIALVGIGLVAYTILRTKFIYAANPSMEGDAQLSMADIGTALMGTGKYQFLLPFEMLSLLLLAAIVGGILIARKDKKHGEKEESQY